MCVRQTKALCDSFAEGFCLKIENGEWKIKVRLWRKFNNSQA